MSMSTSVDSTMLRIEKLSDDILWLIIQRLDLLSLVRMTRTNKFFYTLLRSSEISICGSGRKRKRQSKVGPSILDRIWDRFETVVRKDFLHDRKINSIIYSSDSEDDFLQDDFEMTLFLERYRIPVMRESRCLGRESCSNLDFDTSFAIRESSCKGRRLIQKLRETHGFGFLELYASTFTKEYHDHFFTILKDRLNRIKWKKEMVPTKNELMNASSIDMLMQRKLDKVMDAMPKHKQHTFIKEWAAKLYCIDS